MSIKEKFSSTDNVFMIWEVLEEQDIIKYQSNNIKEEISKFVVNNIVPFYKSYHTNNPPTSLMSLNKYYMKEIITYVKQNYNSVSINKIKIHNNEAVPVTAEEIKDMRELEFNTRFNEIQNDFSNTMTIQKPETPNFQDEVPTDTPNEMEEKIKELTRRRNYDSQLFDKQQSDEKEEEQHVDQEVVKEESNKKSVSWDNSKSLDFFSGLLNDEDLAESNENEKSEIKILKEKVANLEILIEEILKEVRGNK